MKIRIVLVGKTMQPYSSVCTELFQGQTMHWPKEKGQRDKQRSTKEN
jgi:hypothetical protein